MRLIVHGQQAFGQSVLESLLARQEDVVAVYCSPDRGERQDPLKTFAVEKGLPVYQPVSYKDSAVWAEMDALKADLCVMAYVTLFIPEAALNTPRLGSIQYHPSLLPLHKGPSSINWPIIFGEKKTGLSIFWPDNGLDTGPILLQREVDIGPDDTLGSLYFNHLFPMGVEALVEGVDRVRDGTAEKIPQDPDEGTYEGWCRKEDVEVDWTQPVDTVYNLIRGANPQPGAWTTYNDRELGILDCRKADAKGAPGEVVAVQSDSLVVATASGGLQIDRLRAPDLGKIGAGEFAPRTELAPGSVFGRQVK